MEKAGERCRLICGDGYNDDDIDDDDDGSDDDVYPVLYGLKAIITNRIQSLVVRRMYKLPT